MSLKTYEILSLMGDALMNAHASLLKGEELEARTVLHKCLSQFAKQHQVHAQQVAKIVRGQREAFSSHETVLMMSGALMRYVLRRWSYSDETDPSDLSEHEAAYVSVRLNRKGTLIHRSQLEEYLNHSVALKDVSFYDFCSRFKVVRKGTKDTMVLSTYTTGDRIDKLTHYPFLSTYELSKTHEIAEHTTREEAAYMTKFVPRIVGHRLPRVHDQCYKAFMLAHFKPFDRDIPLVPEGHDISEAFDVHLFSDRAKECMKNWEVMHECEDEREAESLRKRRAMMRESELLDKVFDGNLNDLVELPSPESKDMSGEVRSIHDLLRLSKSNWFTPTAKVANDQSQAFKDMRIMSLLIKRWHAEIKNNENIVAASRLNAADASHQFAPEA
ncbi:uncharacterized protein ARMOST_19891 [Armillaria ostoyae]|uniref:Uncharacterized protein n=1 Tax=Armillaria ostoyae TaxID=47428 RepID=A0A284S5U4_ARMOS|nr:uncharacterized protein ARMOST_19891 [Armillaria ostoyae]